MALEKIKEDELTETWAILIRPENKPIEILDQRIFLKSWLKDNCIYEDFRSGTIRTHYSNS